jgi:hypothetical protein
MAKIDGENYAKFLAGLTTEQVSTVVALRDRFSTALQTAYAAEAVARELRRQAADVLGVKVEDLPPSWDLHITTTS